jgi:uncharacterized protein YdaU (DUF1376 family)
MAKFAALPLFTDAWIADTSHLSRLERGIYMDLIILMWRSPNCHIPADIEWIAEHLNIRNSEIKHLKKVCSEFCKWDKGMWTQKRLYKEWIYVSNIRNIKASVAKRRWNNEKKSTEASEPSPTIRKSLTGSNSQRSAPSPSPSKRAQAPTARSVKSKSQAVAPSATLNVPPARIAPINAATLSDEDRAKAESEAIAFIEQNMRR